MRTGVFVGTFDPFTIGHANIVERALPLFDRLVIGVVADNVHKPSMSPAEERVAAIRQVYRDESRVSVEVFGGLAMDFAKEVGAEFFVKGVRSVSDFEYEQAQAEFNRRLGGIETVLLYSEPQLANVSSTAVRELAHFGVDVSQFLPKIK